MSSPAHRDLHLITALALIGLVTLTPSTGAGGRGLPDPVDLLLNMALFVPLGSALRRRDLAPWRVLAFAALASGLIETIQFRIVPGRDSSLWDLMANVTGAGLGATVPVWILSLPAIPLWLASSWLLAPTPPPSETWSGQWARRFSNPAPFSGKVSAITLSGVPAPDGPVGVPLTTMMKEAYRHPPLRFRVAFTRPATIASPALQIASVADSRVGQVIGLWQLDWDVVLTWYARGTRWGLRQPTIRAPGFLESLPDGETTITGYLEPGHAFIEISSDRTFGVRLGPWEGWRLFWPLEPLRPGPAMLLSVLWSAVCLAGPLILGTRRKSR